MRQEFFSDPIRQPVEEAITAMMINGLARVGMGRALQGSIQTISSPDGAAYIDGNYWVSGKGDMFTVDPLKSKDWVKLEVMSFLEGYSYNTERTTNHCNSHHDHLLRPCYRIYYLRRHLGYANMTPFEPSLTET